MVQGGALWETQLRRDGGKNSATCSVYVGPESFLMKQLMKLMKLMKLQVLRQMKENGRQMFQCQKLKLFLINDIRRLKFYSASSQTRTNPRLWGQFCPSDGFRPCYRFPAASVALCFSQMTFVNLYDFQLFFLPATLSKFSRHVFNCLSRQFCLKTSTLFLCTL